MTKACPKCKTTKPLSDFWVRADGRAASRCKPCSTQANREWRANNADYERTRYQACKAETRERHLVRKYGVDLAEYDRLLALQGGKCAICLCDPRTQAHGVFHVDHCHSTGRVRGLLCRGCNHVLGHLNDDPENLRRAIAYLVPQIPEMIGRALLSSLARSPKAMSEEEEIDAEEEAYQRALWEKQRDLPDPREAYDKDDPKHPDWLENHT